MRQANKGPLDNLIKLVGGVDKLASILGVTRRNISIWQVKDDPSVEDKLKINIVCRALKLEDIYHE